MIRYAKMRHAFLMAEMIFGMTILAMVFAATAISLRQNKEHRNIDTEHSRVIAFERGIIKNFDLITDAVIDEAYTRPISSSGISNWAPNIEPLPTMTTKGKLVYKVSNDFRRKHTEIYYNLVSNVSSYCTPDRSSSQNTISFSCPKIVQFTVTNQIVSPSNNGIDPALVPQISMVIARENPTGTVTDTTYTRQIYDFDLSNTFNRRRLINIEKLRDIRDALRSWYNEKLVRELKNKPPKGLNSDTDAFVPWQMMLSQHGTNARAILLSDCDLVANSDKCFSGDASWTGFSWSSWSNITKRTLMNLFGTNHEYKSDAFGNTIFVQPIYNLASKGSDNASGGISVSYFRIPYEGYSVNSVYPKPPFSGAVFIGATKYRFDNYSGGMQNMPPYGRIQFIY